MKLYHSTCTCATAVHIGLEEAGAKYERIEVSWQRGLNVDALEKVNPLGAVPVLVTDDGQVLTQSAVILEHVADTHPQAKLLAAPGTPERLQTLSWLQFCAADLLKSFAPIVQHEAMTSVKAAQPEVKAYGLANARKNLEHVDRSLAGKQFIVGDRFTVADGYLLFLIELARWLEVPQDGLANLRPYVKRLSERPATRRILQLEDLLD